MTSTAAWRNVLEWDEQTQAWVQYGPLNTRIDIIHNTDGWRGRLVFWEPDYAYLRNNKNPTTLETYLGRQRDLKGALAEMKNFVSAHSFLPSSIAAWLKDLVAPPERPQQGVTFVIEAFACPTPGPRRWVVVGRALTQHDAEVIAHKELASDNPVRILREVTPDCVGQWAPEACTRT